VRVCPLFHFLPPRDRGATAAVLTSYPFPPPPSLVCGGERDRAAGSGPLRTMS